MLPSRAPESEPIHPRKYTYTVSCFLWKCFIVCFQGPSRAQDGSGLHGACVWGWGLLFRRKLRAVGS